MRVLQVEDDALAARAITLVLRAAGATTDTAATGAEALDILRCAEYDILIVDLQLPDMQGHQLVARLRAARVATPVLMLTGFAAMPAKMAAFAVGVDDFIAKPVENAELLARLRAIVRRNHGHAHRLLGAGALVLNQDDRETTVAGRPLHLTPKEYSLLELLLLRRGRIVPKHTIRDHLYGGMDEPGSRTVDVFLCNLRRKMADAGAGDLIVTVPGIGYRLDAGERPPAGPPPAIPRPVPILAALS